MTKEKYLELVEHYSIEKIRKGEEIAGGELWSHVTAIKHHDAEERKALLESNKSCRLVGHLLGISKRRVEQLRKEMREGKKKRHNRRKKKPGRKK